MLRNRVFGFALIVLATLGSIAALGAPGHPAAQIPEADIADRIPEHIARLFAAGIVSLENLGL
jgi:hypothetical protein